MNGKGFLVSILSALALAAGCRSPDTRRFWNDHPDVARCRRAAVSQTIPRWDGAPLGIAWAASADAACPAPGFPFIAAAAPSGTRWIQLVEVNVETPLGLRRDLRHALNREGFPWLFLDGTPGLRAVDSPFLNDATDGSFWDNPAWPTPPPKAQVDGVRRWTARTYLVTVDGRRLTAAAGLTWGWTWRVGDGAPEATPPAPLPRSAWSADAALLGAAFPGWQFQ